MVDEIVDRYKQLNIHHKLIALAAILILFSWLSWSNVETAEQDLEAAKTEDQDLQNKIQELSGGGQNLTAIEAKKRKAEQDLAALMELIPSEIEIEEVLAILSASGRDSGVIVARFEPVDTSRSGEARTSSGGPTLSPAPASPEGMASSSSFGGDSTQQMPFKVTINGTYVQLVAFFDRVLSTPRIIRLTDFNFKVDQNATSSSMVSSTNDSSSQSGGQSTGSESSLFLAPDQSPILTCEATLSAYIQADGASLTYAPPPGMNPAPPAMAPMDPPSGEAPPPMEAPPPPDAEAISRRSSKKREF